MRLWIAASVVVSLIGASSTTFGCKKASTPVEGEDSGTVIENLDDVDGGGGDGAGGAEGGGAGGGGGGGSGSGSEAGAAGASAGADGGPASKTGESDKAGAQGGDAAAGAQANAMDGGSGATGSAQGDNAGAGGAAGTAGGTKDPNPTQGGTPSGVVDFLNVNSGGGITGDVLMANLQKAKQKYRACYGKALAADSSAQGTLKLKVSIAVDGKVDKVSVLGGNLTPGPWVQCSVATTSGLKLPPATPSSSGSFDIKFSK